MITTLEGKNAVPNFELDPWGPDTWGNPRGKNYRLDKQEIAIGIPDECAQRFAADFISSFVDNYTKQIETHPKAGDGVLIAGAIESGTDKIALAILAASGNTTDHHILGDDKEPLREPAGDWLKLKEAAKYLGVSQKQLRNRCERKKVRHRREGSRGRGGAGEYRFRREWLDEYAASNTPPTTLDHANSRKLAKRKPTLQKKTFIPESEWGSSVGD